MTRASLRHNGSLRGDGSSCDRGVMARTPFDEYAKDVTLDALRPFGEVEADARITAEARHAYGMNQPVAPGIYEGPPSGTLRLVVIPQLPETPDTLRMRTMGAGPTLTRALREVEAPPRNAKLRTMLGPRIATLRVTLEGDPSPEAQEFVMEAEKIYNRRLAEQHRMGLEKGLEKGLKKGRQEGRQEGLRDAIARVCATRGLSLLPAQRKTLNAMTDEATLAEWLIRAATVADAGDVFAEK